MLTSFRLLALTISKSCLHIMGESESFSASVAPSFVLTNFASLLKSVRVDMVLYTWLAKPTPMRFVPSKRCEKVLSQKWMRSNMFWWREIS